MSIQKHFTHLQLDLGKIHVDIYDKLIYFLYLNLGKLLSFKFH